MADQERREISEGEWRLVRRALGRSSLIQYVRAVAPWFTVEEVHCTIATHLERLADPDDELDRLMVFMPPRTGKSMMGSVFLPSWYSGLFPSDKILQVGHSINLSRNFSLDVRALMRDPEYAAIFPGVALAKDSQAAGNWRIEDIAPAMTKVEGLQRLTAHRQGRQQQGQYNAAGVTANIAGKGFNLGIADDLMSEQDKDSRVVKERIWNWWGPGFYTRRQPERNAILLMMTRWANDDIAGRLLKMAEENKAADKWTVLNIPAILDAQAARTVVSFARSRAEMPDIKDLKAGDSFAPRRWSMKEIMRSKANMTDRDWNALYLGKPDIDEGNILKKHFWRRWHLQEPPECDFVFQMYDTANEKGQENDYSARSTWGIFRHRDREGERPTYNMILLEAWKDRIDTPDLIAEAMIGVWGSKETLKALQEMKLPASADYVKDRLIAAHGRDIIGFQPDRLMIEKKASGHWMIAELRRINKPHRLPVWPWLAPRNTQGAGKGQEMDKYARARFASLVLEQGAVWYMPRKWAEAVIDECAECKFDGSDASDDLPDTVTASMIYVRQTYRVELPTDIDEEAERKPKRTERRRFYGARG